MLSTGQIVLLCVLGTAGVWVGACSANDNTGVSPVSGAGTGGGAGTMNGAAGTVGVAGTGGTAASSAGAGGTSPTAGGSSLAGSGGASGASAGSGGSVGVGGGVGGNRTAPTCAQPTPSPNGARESECDYLLQSLDFEDKYSYPSTAADIKVTSYGTAFGLTAINNCSPYCYGKNLTVGIDIVGGGAAAQMQGEVIIEFPKTGPGLPITVADMNRSSLAWITFDGAAKPPFEIDTQLVVETATSVIPAVESRPFFQPGGKYAPFGPFNVTNNYSFNNGCELKYFPFTDAKGFPNGLANVTGIGFRITAKAAAGQEWHGVAYIDHLQIRGGGGDQPMNAGAYPFGL